MERRDRKGRGLSGKRHKRRRCRLVLITPPTFAPGTFVEAFGAALTGGDVASAIVAIRGDDKDVWRSAAIALLEPAIAAGVALLLEDRLNLVTEIDVDGLHVAAGAKNLRQLAASLSPGKIVGAGGVTDRHEAMVAGESGVDYVLFGSCHTAGKAVISFADVKILTQWWAELIEVPCIAPAISLQQVRELAYCGADFVAANEMVWNHPLGPATAVAEINTVFDEIAEA